MRVYGLLILFVIQFIAGMTLNLFVTLPKNHPGATGGGPALTITAWIALGLLLGALFVLIISIKEKIKSWILFSSIGFVFTLSAVISGLNFIYLGGHNINSLVTAISFIVALSSYAIGLYVNK